MIEEKPPLKLRHEYKHILNPHQACILSARLSQLFPRDPYAGHRGSYRVSSLYFDTPYDKALRQKLDGINRREKFRLRYYGDNTSFIRLEKKFKINGLCGKHAAPRTLEQARRLLSGQIDFLLDSGHPLLLEFYSKLRGQLLAPKTVVTYDREAFVYDVENVRLTIDRNLCGGPAGDFLNPRPGLGPVSAGLTVLEVKYDAFLPELAALAVQLPNRQSCAYSKYAVCRRYD